MTIASPALRVLPVGKVDYTPFLADASRRFLAGQGVLITESARDADVLVSSRLKDLLPHRIRHGKRKGYLVWCQEPRWDTTITPRIEPTLWLPSVTILNVYAGGVYLDNATIWEHCIDRELPMLEVSDRDYFESRPARAAAIMGYVKADTTLRIGGRDIDLIARRQQIALLGHTRGLVDLYGRSWPMPVLSDKGEGHWRERKHRTLLRYRFNICMENTVWPGYCTEKIWDSVRARCLPIYWGEGTNIYDDFPHDSFVDASRFESDEQIWNHVSSMDETEFSRRLNACSTVFNKLRHEHLAGAKRYEAMLLHLCGELRRIVGHQ
jgi:alpha(1,3/1,4) fucosyltransferase